MLKSINNDPELWFGLAVLFLGICLMAIGWDIMIDIP